MGWSSPKPIMIHIIDLTWIFLLKNLPDTIFPIYLDLGLVSAS